TFIDSRIARQGGSLKPARGSPIRRQVKRQRYSARNKFLYLLCFNSPDLSSLGSKRHCCQSIPYRIRQKETSSFVLPPRRADFTIVKFPGGCRTTRCEAAACSQN